MFAYISVSRPGRKVDQVVIGGVEREPCERPVLAGVCVRFAERLVLPDPDAAAAGLDRARRRRGERRRRAEQRRGALSHRRQRDRGIAMFTIITGVGVSRAADSTGSSSAPASPPLTRLARRRPLRLAPRRVHRPGSSLRDARGAARGCLAEREADRKQPTVRHPGADRQFPESALAQSGEGAFCLLRNGSTSAPTHTP